MATPRFILLFCRLQLRNGVISRNHTHTFIYISRSEKSRIFFRKISIRVIIELNGE